MDRSFVELESSAAELSPAHASDGFYDLEFLGYRPLRPLAGKSRPENLLWQSLRTAGLLDDWSAPLLAVCERFGRTRLHWGHEREAGRSRWLVRIAAREQGYAVLDELGRALAPWLTLPDAPTELDGCARIAFAFDHETLARGRLDTVELHRPRPNPDSPNSPEVVVARVGPGASLAAPRLDPPSYMGFASKREVDRVLARLRASEVVDIDAAPQLLGRVLIPELFASRRLVIGSDPAAGVDTVVFSGISVDQLLWFMRRFEFPDPDLAFVAAHQDELSHLLFDARLRYRFDPATQTVEHLTVGVHASF